MTGLMIRFDGVFTDPGLPVFKYDPLLTDGAGSLFLGDVRTWAPGVPAHGDLLSNIAREQAATAGIAGDTSASFAKIGDLSGTKGRIERSGKGGLAGIVSQATDPLEDNGYAVALPENIKAYILANQGHNFYISLWKRITRQALTNAGAARCLAAFEVGGSGGAVTFRLTESDSQMRPSGTDRLAISGLASANALGPARLAIAGKGSDSAPLLSNYTTPKASVCQIGPIQAQNRGTVARQTLQSWIFYRAYIEDLTLSGRSFATVDALDGALYAEAFAAGGRFADDTFTAPSTVP